MLSTDQLVNDGLYGIVGNSTQPTPVQADLTSGPTADAQGIAGSQDLTRFLGADVSRPPMSEVLRWADQLLDELHRRHTLSPPTIHGQIAPSNLQLDPVSGITIVTKIPKPGSDPNVNYRPLEQLWPDLDQLSQRVILNRYSEDAEKTLLQPLSPASDIYSVGATLYAISTGVAPPDALDRCIAAIEGKTDPLRSPAEVDPAIPIEISDVIVKAMSLWRDDRHYSAVILRQIFRTAAVRVKERETAQALPARRRTDQSEPPLPKSLQAVAPVESVRKVDNKPERLDQEKARELARRILAEKAAESPLSEESSKSTPVPSAPGGVSPDGDILEIPIAPVDIVHPTPKQPSQSVALATEYAQVESGGNWRLPAFAIASVIVVAGIGGGIYKFAGSSPSVDRSPVTGTQFAAEPQREVTATIPTPLPEVTSTAPPETQPTLKEPIATQEKLARTQAAPQDKTKKPAAVAPAKTPKKALTVDDLINDH